MHKEQTNLAFINDKWLPLEQARVSALDRGFLFGDGIYEVIPVHLGKPVALRLHLERLESGLQSIGILEALDFSYWQNVISEIIDKNKSAALPYQGLYIQVTRGADTKRHHSFPKNVKPTHFAFMFEIPHPPSPNGMGGAREITGLNVGIGEDKRWRRCHIKSTSLLGNVLHFQQGASDGFDETILYNEKQEITEASACNVFIVKQKRVLTAPLDNQLLPGITRHLVIDAIEHHTDFEMHERAISLDELYDADEVWLTSSTKEIMPVVSVNRRAISDGKPGRVWRESLLAFNKVKFD